MAEFGYEPEVDIAQEGKCRQILRLKIVNRLALFVLNVGLEVTLGSECPVT